MEPETNVCKARRDCQKPIYSLGLCLAHYWQSKSGKPFRKVPWTAEDRFWSRVQKGELQDDCWLWTGAINTSGYGKFSVGYKDWSAHRYSFYLHRGYIPEKPLEVDHLCRVRACVNPDHLRETTRRGNAESRSPNRWGKLGIRNVRWDQGRGKYYVSVESKGINHFGGRFTDLEEAKIAASELRKRVFSEDYRD